MGTALPPSPNLNSFHLSCARRDIVTGGIDLYFLNSSTAPTTVVNTTSAIHNTLPADSSTSTGDYAQNGQVVTTELLSSSSPLARIGHQSLVTTKATVSGVVIGCLVLVVMTTTICLVYRRR